MRGHRERLTRRRVLAWTAGLALALALCLLAAASLGAGRVTLWEVLGPGRADAGAVERAILWQVRLPRVLLAAVLGGALTVAGVVFQALLRNPLADPYVLGVSGGASVGAVVALLAGLGAAGAPLGGAGVQLLAFAGALAALFLIERAATLDGRLTVYAVLLTGAVFNAFAAALIFFLQSVASFEELHAMVFQLMGRIPAMGYGRVGGLAAAVTAGTVALYAGARDYNALSLGEEAAAQLGVDVERVKRRTFVLGSLLTGLAVSVGGMIGFVGLVVPHLLRLLLGPDHRLLLPVAFFGGGAFLVVADLLSRTVAAPNELPVGVVTALVGGPFFLYLLRRRGEGHEFG